MFEGTLAIRSPHAPALHAKQSPPIIRLICAGWFALALVTTSALALADGILSGVPYAEPMDPVQIASVSYEPQQIRRGDTVLAEVVCTSNTTSVTAEAGGFRLLFDKTAPGVFQTRIHVPHSPLVGSHQSIVVTAIGADGATAQRVIPIEIH